MSEACLNDTTNLGVCGQACTNYPKWQVCYFFAISYERSEWWSWFFACRGAWRFPASQCYDFAKVPKIASLQCLNYNISNKNVVTKLIFCIFFAFFCTSKLISTLCLGIKVFYKVIPSSLIGMIKHSQITQSNKFAIFLQYLKKEVRVVAHFCMQINIKVSTSWHYCFWWNSLDMSKVLKIESW